MRVSVLSFQSGKLLRGVALGLIAGLGAGCSSDFSRFAPTSADFTGSVNQQQIIHKSGPVTQPFPEEISPVADSQFEEPAYTGSIENGSIRPVASTVRRTVLAPVAATGSKVVAGARKIKDSALRPVSPARRAVSDEPLPAPAMPDAVAKKQPRKMLPIADGLDDTVTGAVEPTTKRAVPAAAPLQEAVLVKPKVIKSSPASENEAEGRIVSEATSIIVEPGDTISHIANRYGVPASAILKANKLESADSIKSGRKLIIPAHVQTKAAKTAVSDDSADVADGKTPLPKKLPARENVAVLPAATKPKAKQEAAATNAPVKLKTIKPETSAEAKPKSAKPAEVAAVAPKPVKTIVLAEQKSKPSGAAPGTYTVASGDSLYVIAKKNGTTVDRLKAANGITDAKLKIGQVLKVPAAGEVTVAAADPGVDPIITGSAGSKPKKPAVTAPAAAPKAEPAAAPSAAVMDEADKDTSAAPSATGISKLRWPVRGRTLVGYGQADAGRTNDGVDISVPVGTPVKAAENGVVIYAGTGLKDFGNTVLIRHENGLVTVYGHNGDLVVKRGETIKRGQEIARSGMSGSTKVPKLHFEVRKNSKPVNPVTFLE